MDWLTATLSFATVMLFFSVVVSTLVEMIHRFAGLREKGLQLMLESLFERVIQPQIGKLNDPGTGSAVDAKAFAAIIMANRAVQGAKSSENLKADVDRANAAYKAAMAADKGHESYRATLASATKARDEAIKAAKAQPSRLSRLLRYMLSASQMTSIPVEIFTQKLADSRIVNKVDAEMDAIVQDISQKYVAFGSEATEYFRRRARLFSVLVAFPVAFMFYVHPYDLANILISDPALAQKVADHRVKLTYDVGVDPEAAISDARVDAPSAADTTTPTSPVELTKDELVARLTAQNKALKAGIEEWDALGIPIGWPDNSTLPKCADPDDNPTTAERWNWLGGGCTSVLPWLDVPVARATLPQMFWLLVGGLLIGLGAPFWAQAVGALTVMRGATQKIASIVEGDDTVGAAASSPPAAEKKKGPTAVRTFQVSRKVSPAGDAAKAGGGRAVAKS